MSTRQRTRRLNIRALAGLALVGLAALAAVAGLARVRPAVVRGAYLTEARARLAQGQDDLALGYLNRHLEAKPGDIEALDLKAQILADAARDETQAAEAARVLAQVLGRDPDRQDARRRLVRVNLLMPMRARAAESQARELIARGADDAEAHRLLAHALELIGILEKRPEAIEQARLAYEKAEAKDPGDVEGAERLAALYRDRFDNPALARQVLDKLVEATAATSPAKHAAALLARARHALSVHDDKQASEDIAQAIQAAPQDLDARLAAAQNALRGHDPATARAHLAAIDAASQNDPRVLISAGLAALAEQRPEEAIAAWRAGLVKTGGTDSELTWRLAHVLLETGRAIEAAPLIDQYQRLAGGDEPPPRARFLKALQLLQTGMPAKALAELEAIRYKVDKPLEPHVLHAMGRALEANGEPAKALEAYRQAAETSRDWSAPWAAVARLELLEKPDRAIATLERGLAFHHDDPALLTAVAGVRWSQEIAKPQPQRDWSAFESALESARKVAPGSPDLALVEADYLVANGRVDDAEKLLQAASRVYPEVPELWLARANALARSGRLGKALDVLEQAVAAAGPRAGFYLTRASYLTLKGQVADAREALKTGIGRVPSGEKSQLWRSLGDLEQAQGERDAARSAYESWARLQPDNPEPRLSLVGLALDSGDAQAISSAVATVRQAGGPDSPFWRIARVEELLHGASADSAGLDEAEALLKELQVLAPTLAAGFLLEARLAELRGEVDRAIKAYQQAADLGAGPAAVTPLIALLVREKRDEELAKVRATTHSSPGGVERLATVQALRSGDHDRAARLAAMAVQGDPNGIDTRVWQAEVLQALGQPEQAEATLKALVNQQPKEPAPWLSLLMLQVARKQPAEAAATVESMRKVLKPGRPELLWAQCYRAIGDQKRAIAFYEQSLKRWPGEWPVLSSAVDFYEQAGQPERSVAALRGWLQRDPSHGWANRKLARALAARAENLADWREALGLIGEDARPDDVTDDVLTRAWVYSRGPEPAHRRKALEILEGLVRQNPNLAAAQDPLARLLLAAGQPKLAREHSAKAATGSRATIESMLLHANILIILNDLDSASKMIERLGENEAAGPAVIELQARLLAAQGRGSEAAELLEKAFGGHAGDQDAPAVGERLARLLGSLNQWEAAEGLARQAASKSPKGQLLLAEVLAERGNLDEAAESLEAAAKAGEPVEAATIALGLAARPGADPRWLAFADRHLTAAAVAPSLESLEKMALLRHLQGRFNDEIQTYSLMLKRKPTSFGFLNNMAWTISEDLNRPDIGVKWADEAVKKVGAQPHVLDTRGVILTRLGRLDEALRDLEAAARDQPTGPVFFHLARAYKRQGDETATRRAATRARQAGLARDHLAKSDQADWDSIMIK